MIKCMHLLHIISSLEISFKQPTSTLHFSLSYSSSIQYFIVRKMILIKMMLYACIALCYSLSIFFCILLYEAPTSNCSIDKCVQFSVLGGLLSAGRTLKLNLCTAGSFNFRVLLMKLFVPKISISHLNNQYFLGINGIIFLLCFSYNH